MSAQTVAQSALFGTVLEYPTVGCGGAVVITPLPGQQFVAADAHRGTSYGTERAQLFYAQAAAHHVRWATSMHCAPSRRTHTLNRRGAPGSASGFGLTYTTYTGDSWSGWQISDSAQYVQAGWTLPAVVSPYFVAPQVKRIPPIPPDIPPPTVAIWTGIGGGYGSGSGPLIQSGTTAIYYQGSTSAYFWYQIVGGPTDLSIGHQITSMGVEAGDFVANVVSWTPYDPFDPDSAGTANLGNYSTPPSGGDQCVNFEVPGTPQPGVSTEWIVEAPATISGGRLPLANFGMVHFTNAVWTDDYTDPPNATAFTIAQGDNPSTYLLEQSTDCHGDPTPCRTATAGPLDADGAGFTDTFSSTD